MNRDKIENAAAAEIDLSEFLPAPKPQAKGAQYVNINAEVSPSVLAGILGVADASIYKYRQDGKLPPNSDATLRDCIKHHVLFWKNKSTNKATGLSEAALLQKVQLDRARTESTWLQIKKDRGELVDTKLLAQVFEPHFLHMRTQLCSIARKFPEVQKEIDAILNGWAKLGEEMRVTSQQELDTFIEQKMDEEIEIEDYEADSLLETEEEDDE